MSARRRLDWARIVLSLVVLTLLGACAQAPTLGLQFAPDPLQIDPSRPSAEIRLTHIGPGRTQLEGFRFEGPQWAALRISDATNPSRVMAGDGATLHLELDAKPFRHEDASGNLRGWDRGAAELVFQANGVTRRIPITIAPPDASRQALTSSLLAALALALLWFVGRVALSQATPPRAAALAVGFVLALAPLPFADAWCDAASIDPGAAMLAQCRAGLHGVGLSAWPSSVSLVVTWLGLAVLVPRNQHDAHLSSATAVLLGLAFAVFAAEFGSTDLNVIVLDQGSAFDFGGLRLPGWGILRRPAAGVLVLVAVALPASLGASGRPWRIASAAVAAALLTGSWADAPAVSEAWRFPTQFAWMIAKAAALFGIATLASRRMAKRSVSERTRLAWRWLIPSGLVLLILRILSLAW